MPIVNVALDVPLPRLFSYISDEPLSKGARVYVPFGSKQLVGFVWQEDVTELDCPKEKLKSIIQVFPESLDQKLMNLIEFISNYYHHPLGQVVFSAIPKQLRRPDSYRHPKANKVITTNNLGLAEPYVQLNNEQQDIVTKICGEFGKFYPTLLYGITGSGKTEVYLEIIAHSLKLGQQVLFLVPEINLTPQLKERFQRRFPDISLAILTSKISDGKRLQAYFESSAGVSQIIIGTRLSVFTPFKNLGLIIVDEEHDQSFKQNDSLRYNARDVAVYRAFQENIPIVLGSATPSFESLYNHKIKRYNLYKLTKRAVVADNLPKIKLLDMRNYPNVSISQEALTEIDARLAKGELSLVFINRRGYAPTVSCYDCGHVIGCRHCATKMVYHNGINKLRCHHCGYTIAVPKTCVKCDSPHLQIFGTGTQRIEEELHSSFPEARIARIDQDTIESKSAWDKLYMQVRNHEVDILVGTQMLAKGHDFHNLTLVVGLNVDSSLYSFDFRAPELLFSQLTQVSGRAGRGDKPGLVLLQTNYPEHELYQYLQANDFSGFANYVMQERKLLALPPYSHYAIIRAHGRKLDTVLKFLGEVVTHSSQFKSEQVRVFPPVPAVLHRLKNKERAQVLIQASARQSLHIFLEMMVDHLKNTKLPSGVNYSLDIDPLEI